MNNKEYTDLRDVLITVQNNLPVNTAQHMLRGIELSSPTLSIAAAHGLSKALNRPDTEQFLLEAGMSQDAIHWLMTVPGAATQLSDQVRIILPSVYFNGRAALELSIIKRETARTVDEQHSFHDAVINYLMLAGAHAAMMFDLCNLSKTAFDKRIKLLSLQAKTGRPSSIKNSKRINSILDEWSRLLREQKLASERAARNNEPYISASKAELYIKLHMLFAHDDIAALYSIVESCK